MPSILEICPVCETGTLSQTEKPNEVKHRGFYGIIPCLGSTCNHCGVEIADADQLAKNKAAMLNFRTNIDKKIG